MNKTKETHSMLFMRQIFNVRTEYGQKYGQYAQ